LNAATIENPTSRLQDLLITPALTQRHERAPNLRAEVEAFGELSQILGVDPRRAVRRFTQVALRLCAAGSAGLSLLKANTFGHMDFKWEVVSGALDAREGDATPRDFSSCGLCLDLGTAILLSQPEREFRYLARLRPTIFEVLTVPLYDTARRPLGALWVAHHDPGATFCANDLRIMEQLAIHLVLALKLVREASEHRSALDSLEWQRAAQQTVTRHLVEERERRARAEVSETGMRQSMIFKDAVIQEAHHRVKNTLQIAASVLSLHAKASSSPEVRAALQESFARLHLLAKVHELLYSGADKIQEVLMPKLFLALGDALRASFVEVSTRVTLHISSDHLLLPADDAIPMALLVNEAITNAYKHAFPTGCHGTITADLSCTLDNTIILCIADTGVGMQSKNAKGGLGLKLIRSFAQQLGGVLAFGNATNSGGTSLKLTIPRDVTAVQVQNVRVY
jgi:two-component sensor histidine kinase